MRLRDYIKDKLYSILLFLGMLFIVLLILLAFKSSIELIWGLIITITLVAIIIFLSDFFRKRNFYKEFLNNLNALDQKYLVLETIKMPNFYEGKILVNSMYEINKSMLEKIKGYEVSTNDFKEYIELWIHEVKLPLSTISLMVHNHKDKYDKKLLEQLQRLDNYLEQILYYVRSENAEEDYLIKDNSLRKMIGEVALKNKDILLENDIELTVSDIDMQVLTDSKWFVFILNQIVNNSIKYRDENKKSYIKIMAQEDDAKIVLVVYDNGIGISRSDLPKVFDKSFTGLNGRGKANSTGMGLYIVKQMCVKLGHKIEIKSEELQYTMVKITLSKNNYYGVVK